MAKSHWHLDDTPQILKDMDYLDSLEPKKEAIPPRNQLPKACKLYKKYQGLMPPKCSGGTGCQVCWLIYEVKNGI